MTTPTPELVALLPLPEAIKEICVVGPHCAELRETLEDYYDANEMEEYARACIEATRAATVPQGVSDDVARLFIAARKLSDSVSFRIDDPRCELHCRLIDAIASMTPPPAELGNDDGR